MLPLTVTRYEKKSRPKRSSEQMGREGMKRRVKTGTMKGKRLATERKQWLIPPHKGGGGVSRRGRMRERERIRERKREKGRNEEEEIKTQWFRTAKNRATC